MDTKWILRFYKRAQEVSTWSKDPSTKIGAVFVDPKYKIELSSGYNGFPRGVDDLEQRYNDRQEKYKFVVHAEMNGIYNASRIGRSLDGSSLFIHGLVICHECAKGLIQVGVKDIYLPVDYVDNINERWEESWKITKLLLDEADIKVHLFNNK